MWQVCIEDAGTGILISRVHHGMAFTRSSAIRKANRLNAEILSSRWDSIRAVPIRGSECQHLITRRVT